MTDKEFINLAMEFGKDMLNTISSIEEEFPKTKEARMARRMELRNKFTNAVYMRAKKPRAQEISDALWAERHDSGLVPDGVKMAVAKALDRAIFEERTRCSRLVEMRREYVESAELQSPEPINAAGIMQCIIEDIENGSQP